MSRLAQATGGEMLAISWRSSRRQLVAWTVGMLALFVATATSVNGLYGSPAELATYARATAVDTTIYAINGRPFGLDTIGGPIAYEFGFIGAIAIPLMAITLMTRMTRLEEQTGRMELLRAGVIGRTAALKAGFVLTTGAFVVVAAGMALALAALGLSRPGVLLYPLSLAVLGLAFAAIAALGAQLVAYARAVTAIGLGVLVIAFALRGVGDVRDNAVVWLSPLGWAEQTRAFGDARWWPLLLLLAVAGLAMAGALRLAGQRDLGEGLVSRRRGRTHAGRALLHSFGVAIRRHRNAVLGWSVIAGLVGVAFGSLGAAFDTATQDNGTLQDVLGGGSGADNAFVSFVVILIALISLGFVVSGVGRAAEEEADGRLEPMLAGELSRPRWLAGHAVALVGGLLVVAIAGGLGLGVSNALSTGDSTQVWRLVGATFAYLPAAGVLLGLSAALYGLRPGWLWLAWLPFVFVTVVAVLGDTLQLPDWAMNISPLTWVGRVPLENVGTGALAWSLGLGLGLASLALVSFRIRDIPSR